MPCTPLHKPVFFTTLTLWSVYSSAKVSSGDFTQEPQAEWDKGSPTSPNITNSQLLIPPTIDYPVEAKNRGIEAEFLIQFTLDETGEKNSLLFLAATSLQKDFYGDPYNFQYLVFLFEAEIKKGLKSALISPAELNGRPIATVMQMPLSFKLDKDTLQETELLDNKFLWIPKIRYPSPARDAGIEALLTVQASVDAQGALQNIKIVEASSRGKAGAGKQFSFDAIVELFGDETRRLMSEARFPPVETGQAAAARVARIQVNFILDENEAAQKEFAPAKMLWHPSIKYPPFALDAGIEANLEVDFEIDADGKPHNAKIVKASSTTLSVDNIPVNEEAIRYLFEPTISNTVLDLRFSPRIQNSRRSWTQIITPFNFQLGYTAEKLKEKFLNSGIQSPHNAQDFIRRGDAYIDYFLDLDKAQSDYDHAISLDPKNVSAYLRRSDMRRYKGDHRGALADLANAYLINATNPWTLSRFALYWANEGNYKRAL